MDINLRLKVSQRIAYRSKQNTWLNRLFLLKYPPSDYNNFGNEERKAKKMVMVMVFSNKVNWAIKSSCSYKSPGSGRDGKRILDEKTFGHIPTACKRSSVVCVTGADGASFTSAMYFLLSFGRNLRASLIDIYENLLPIISLRTKWDNPWRQRWLEYCLFRRLRWGLELENYL